MKIYAMAFMTAMIGIVFSFYPEQLSRGKINVVN